MKKQTIELLAPAGSWEALEAAVNAGADAVYMGGKAFGARQYASNFDREEMQKAVYFAHMTVCDCISLSTRWSMTVSWANWLIICCF